PGSDRLLEAGRDGPGPFPQVARGKPSLLALPIDQEGIDDPIWLLSGSDFEEINQRGEPTRRLSPWLAHAPRLRGADTPGKSGIPHNRAMVRLSILQLRQARGSDLPDLSTEFGHFEQQALELLAFEREEETGRSCQDRRSPRHVAQERNLAEEVAG